MREYAALKQLRAGEVLNVEGVDLPIIPGDIEPGDWYIGQRNTGPQLSVCSKIDLGCIFGTPAHVIYPYNIDECVRVEPTEKL